MSLKKIQKKIARAKKLIAFVCDKCRATKPRDCWYCQFGAVERKMCFRQKGDKNWKK